MQGFNMGRYRPYDSDPRQESFNGRTGTHALGKRAHKIEEGILVVRFELPFNVWCEGCQGHIGQGVRYNAEKQRVGEYYSTPIFSFKCKTACCQNVMIIETDPKNTRYVVKSGARQQNSDWDPAENGGFAIHDDGKPSTAIAPPPDAFSALEKSISDRTVSKTRATRLEELQESATSRSSDPYAINSALRNSFRKEKKERQTVARRDTELMEKIGWSAERALVPEVESVEERESRKRLWMNARDERAGVGSSVSMSRPRKSRTAASAQTSKADATTALAARLRANTKQRADPFHV
ncbi:hypothetical protein CBS101457_002475 [Exobasidium rhododendri]|nr:hypothetical protein CBS101457_002475 [Exobasidium rhododendri]